MFKIEKNVALPKTNSGRGHLYPFNEMKFGDSFFVPCEKQDAMKVSASIRNTALKRRIADARFIFRTVEGGVRVWKVRKPL